MKKWQGSDLLANIIVAGMLTSLMAVSAMKVHSSSFNVMLSSKRTVQAKQYALSKINLLKVKGYSSLESQGKTQIGTTSFYDQVILGDETNYSSTIKQRAVTVNVYNGDETIPRSSLNTVMYSAAASATGGCQVATGTDSVSVTANGAYKSITVIMGSKFTPADGTWTGSATCTAYVDGSSIGSVTTSTKTSKGGSKGHYWGTTEAVTNMKTFNKSVVSGNTIKASVTSSSRHSGTTLTIILGS